MSLVALALPLVLLACLDQTDEPLQLALDCGGGVLCLTSGGWRWARKALSLSTRLPSAAWVHRLLQVGAHLAIDIALLTLSFAHACLLLADSDAVVGLDEVAHLLVLLLRLQQKLRLPFDRRLDLHVVHRRRVICTLLASIWVIAQLSELSLQLMQWLRHGLCCVGRLVHFLLGRGEHVGSVWGRALVAEDILHLSLPDDRLQLLIILEAFEVHYLAIDPLLQQSLFCLRHGLADECIFERLLFVHAVPLRVGRVIALNDINRLFNRLIICDFLHGLH